MSDMHNGTTTRAPKGEVLQFDFTLECTPDLSDDPLANLRARQSSIAAYNIGDHFGKDPVALKMVFGFVLSNGVKPGYRVFGNSFVRPAFKR